MSLDASLKRELENIPYDEMRAQFEREQYLANISASRLKRDNLLNRAYCLGTTSLRIVSGTDDAGHSGKVEIPIHANLCFPSRPEWSMPVMIAKPQFTATPNTDSPVFLTWTFEAEEKQTDGGWYYLDLETNVQLQPQPGHYLEDAKITVYSWPHEGKKLTHVSFSWICFVELAWYAFRGG